MKKTVSLLLALLLVFGGVSAFAGNDLIGEWIATEIIYDGQAIDPTLPGNAIQFTVKEGGVFTADLGGDKAEGTWVTDGSTVTFTVGDVPEVFTYDGTCLLLEYGDSRIRLERAGTAAPAAEAVSTMDTFIGDWVLIDVIKRGVSITPAEANLQIEFTLRADGTFAIIGNGDTREGVWSLSGNVITLTVASSSETLVYDGVGLRSGNTGMTLFFARAGAAAPAPEVTAPTEEAVTEFAGDWILTGVIGDNVTRDPADLDMHISFTLKADGTFSMTAFGSTNEGTWTATRSAVTLTMKGMSEVLAYDGAVLKGDDGDNTLLFTRTGAAPAAAVPSAFARPADVAAQDISAFDGTWIAAAVCMDGTCGDASLAEGVKGVQAEKMLGKEMVIRGGSVDFENEIMSFSLTDGALYCVFHDSPFYIRLLEGDMLEFTSPFAEFTLIFTRKAA